MRKLELIDRKTGLINKNEHYIVFELEEIKEIFDEALLNKTLEK